MARSQKPRRTHRPKGVNAHAHLIAIERQKVLRQPVSEEFAAEFEMAALTALDAVTRGYGNKSSWDMLANCLNHGWLMARAGIGHEAREMFNAAHEAMRRTVPGFDATGRINFVSASDQRIVEQALAAWSQQLRLATMGEIDAATRVVEREYYRTPERRAAA